MKRILVLLTLLLWPQTPRQPWSLELGVQMPKDTKPITSLVLYFKHPPERPPICTVDFGEAQFSTVNAGYAVLGGRANTRVDFHCSERTP